MIKNLLCECCYKCETPDLDVDTINSIGSNQDQIITCNHMQICYKVKEEMSKDKQIKGNSDYDRGFQNGYKAFYERINDHLDTHGTNESLIRAQLISILNELDH